MMRWGGERLEATVLRIVLIAILVNQESACPVMMRVGQWLL